jgi:Ca-activated chloride channel homolog
MSELQFVNPSSVHLLWVGALFMLFLVRARLGQSGDIGSLLSPKLQHELLARTSRSSRWLQFALFASMLLLGILALMRPQTPGANQDVSAGRTAADIMVVLDLSKSMLAEDSAPNRLDRAKSEITELVEQLSGHRIGLVGFAGRSSVLCPLTTDYGFFGLTLGNAGPGSISRGGTRIGDALRTAVSAFGPGQASRIILLVTDGEDHDSYPKEEAEAAKEEGIRVVAIGFGSEEGSQITVTDPQTGARSVLLDRDGRPVLSRLDGETLREVALLTEGAYVPAGVAALDLESIVREHIQPMVRMGSQTSSKVVPREHYAALVLAAFLCMMGAVWAGGRPEEASA